MDTLKVLKKRKNKNLHEYKIWIKKNKIKDDLNETKEILSNQR